MKVAVISGSGFIGRPTLLALQRLGAEVAVTTRMESAPLEGVVPITAQRAAWGDLAAKVLEWKPDVVLDYRAMTRNDGRHLRESFQGRVQRIVAISSVDVYLARDRVLNVEPGEIIPAPMTEESPLRTGFFIYADPKPTELAGGDTYEKILMEREVLQAEGSESAVIRLPMVYGPGDRQTRTAPYLARMRAGRETILLSSELAQWIGPRCFVQDVGACAARLCLTRGATGAFHVGEEPACTEKEWVERIARAAGWTGEIVTVAEAELPEPLRQGYNFAQHWWLDASRVKNELGWRQEVALDEAMAQTVAWQDENMPERKDQDEWDAEDGFLQSKAKANSH